MARVTYKSKFDRLAKLLDMTQSELAEAALEESIDDGICMNPGCDYVDYVPDSGTLEYCTECSTASVRSAVYLSENILNGYYRLETDI